MYEQLKKLIPKAFIKKNEKLLRNLISIFYRGNKFQCNICGFKMSNFIRLKNTDKLCPKCGSLARTRKLWDLLESEVSGKTVLHFSPSLTLKTKMESVHDIHYITTDYEGEFAAAKRLNIESIDEPNDVYDLVICFHVLEHIEHDIKAMEELFRIIRPKGKCIIQTPFKTGEIYENEQIKTEEDRVIHFGQRDHVRIYSVEGLMKRLEGVGFHTELKEFNVEADNTYGFNPSEQIIIAKKPLMNN